MMVVLVSQCEKKALKKTRRVLDAFANRIGDNTWQTLITEDGLLTLKKMLRKTASKSTAVSCHWIRSRSRSQFLWVVGNKNKFNQEGVVPVNRTQKDLLKSEIENDWHYLPLIQSLAGLSALLHDWGKATKLFQAKLKPRNNNKFKGDPIRHEWISLLLFIAFVKNTNSGNITSDEGWLSELSKGNIDKQSLKNAVDQQPEKALKNLPPIAKLVAWLIVSHHRLPLPGGTDKLKIKEKCNEYKGESAESIDQMLGRITKEWGYENRYDEADYQKRLAHCFTFNHGLLSQSKLWMQQVKRWSQRLLSSKELAEQAIFDDSYRVVVTHARLCLMLGDHFYSSQAANSRWQSDSSLFANTDRASGELKQKLDEHLVGVAKHALQTAHLLPAFEQEPPQAQGIENLRKASPKQFQWQDKAVTKIKNWQEKLSKDEQKGYGFFTVNMASTGCGKTFANAKIMRALSSDSESLRFILALGLRTLTLQTGDEYRERVGLDNSELAVLIGSRAVMELHQQNNANSDENSMVKTGSESEEQLLSEEVDFECDIPEEGLATVLTCDRDRQFLYAPVLACTIDHLMAATETKRGGRYILPTLRLMSSDLVIDEIDDFTGDDLIAIGRLIHLAGMLGRKVMISSATIPPYMAEGYFNAYREGWQLYCKTRNVSPVIGCAWVDEYSTQVESSHGVMASEAILDYRSQHHKFIEKRVAKLKKEPAKRKADISECQFIIEQHQGQSHQQTSVVESKRNAYFDVILQSILVKHQDHHFNDKRTQLNVSFGVVRVANISPCVDLTRYLLSAQYPEDTEVRVMAYHSQQVLLMRSIQEQHLDMVLKRKEKQGEAPQALSNPIIRQHLTKIQSQDKPVKNVIFILVATPVEEVGRDHDFDWAVIEPSSYRSIIQLAGRVKRHRNGEVQKPNISLLQYNFKGLKNHHLEDSRAFIRPGFEDKLQLNSHNLMDLIDVQSVSKRVDAIPRIQQPSYLNLQYIDNLQEASSLIELEHVATRSWVANYKSKQPGAQTDPSTLQGWLKHHWFLSALAQQLTPFRSSEPSLKAYLVFDYNQQESQFCERDDKGYMVERENTLNIQRTDLTGIEQERLWLVRNFDEACIELANDMQIDQRIVSMRYGELNFPHDEKKTYCYSDQLGLVEQSKKLEQ